MTALPKPAYVMSEPHLSGWRVVLGYETLADAQAAQAAVSAPEAREEVAAWRFVSGMNNLEWAYATSRPKSVSDAEPLYTHPAAPSADKLREVLRDLMDMEFAKDWRTWSEDRATRLLGIGPRLDAFLAAREAALKAEGA